jgi:hypothetical protein
MMHGFPHSVQINFTVFEYARNRFIPPDSNEQNFITQIQISQNTEC